MILCAVTVALAAPRIVDPVTDEADVLAPADEAALDARIRALREATGVQVAVLTVPSLGGQPIEQLSLAAAEGWAGGRSGRDDGLLVVLAVRDRRSRIEVGYGLEGYVTDLDAARLLRAATPELAAGRYGPALGGIVDGLAAEVDGLAPGTPIPPERRLLGAGVRLARGLQGPAPLGAVALAGGGLGAALGWGWWGVGPPVALARWLHARWRRFVGGAAAGTLGVLAAAQWIADAALPVAGVALAGAAVFGPVGASTSRVQLLGGAVVGLAITGVTWALSLGGGEWTPAFWSMYPSASIIVAFFALDGGWRGGGGGGSGTSSSWEPPAPGPTSTSSGSSGSSGGGDWSGGGGRFGGGGASGSW